METLMLKIAFLKGFAAPEGGGQVPSCELRTKGVRPSKVDKSSG